MVPHPPFPLHTLPGGLTKLYQAAGVQEVSSVQAEEGACDSSYQPQLKDITF